MDSSGLLCRMVWKRVFSRRSKFQEQGKSVSYFVGVFPPFFKDLLLSYREPLKQGEDPNQQGNKTHGNYSEYFLLDLLVLEDHEKSSYLHLTDDW